MNAPRATSRGPAPPRGAASFAGRAESAGEAILGRWRLTKLLETREWWQVFRAAPADTPAGDAGDFAVKKPLPEHASSRLVRAMLRREAIVCREVNHPHLPAVLADNSDEQIPFLVLPFVRGLSLQAVLESLRSDVPWPFATGKALWICRQVAAALEALHERRWMHSELSPAKIYLAPDGHVTLYDLNSARRLAGEECRVTSDAPADPRYAAPESFAVGGFVSAASDIYGLGIVLSQLLTGRLPLEGSGAQRWAAVHRTVRPPCVRETRPQITLETAELVRRMLAKEPLRRPTAGEVLRWLAELEITELAYDSASDSRR